MAADGRELGEIKPTKPAGDAWRAAYVRAPREPARLVATIDAPNRWLAFSEPIVMSTLSYHSWRLCKDAEWLLAMGLGLLIASAIATAGAKVARKDPTTAGSIRGPVERP